MISCTEFIPAYSELFKYIDETSGRQAVYDFWKDLFKPENHPLNHLIPKFGKLRACWENWYVVFTEEACDNTMLYNEEEGSFEHLAQHYPTAITVNHQLIIYLSKDFLYCNREAGAYYLLIEDNLDDTINIYFYEKDKDAIYSIERCILKTEVPAS